MKKQLKKQDKVKSIVNLYASSEANSNFAENPDGCDGSGGGIIMVSDTFTTKCPE